MNAHNEKHFLNYYYSQEENNKSTEPYVMDLNEFLTDHFTLRELLYSETCVRLGMINRVVNPELIVSRLRTLCQKVLEPLRREVGPVTVVSGYRSPCLNYVVGGVTNSQHCKGEAADLYTPNKAVARRYFDFIRNNLDFDQLLLERSKKTGHFWVHVSYTNRRPNRKMVREMEG